MTETEKAAMYGSTVQVLENIYYDVVDCVADTTSPLSGWAISPSTCSDSVNIRVELAGDWGSSASSFTFPAGTQYAVETLFSDATCSDNKQEYVIVTVQVGASF